MPRKKGGHNNKKRHRGRRGSHYSLYNPVVTYPSDRYTYYNGILYPWFYEPNYNNRSWFDNRLGLHHNQHYRYPSYYYSSPYVVNDYNNRYYRY